MQAEQQEINSPARGSSAVPKFLKILTGILIVMFPVGIFLMFTEFGKQYLWTTTLFLGLQAVIMFFVLIKLADTLSASISLAVIFLFSFFVEWWGVNTGFPFGQYYYTEVLQPKLSGVPIAIAFAWFVVSSSSLLLVRFLLRGASGIAISFVSASLILAVDMMLEPFAAFINNFWEWDSTVLPPQNFIAWFVLGFIFSFGLNKLLKWKSETNTKLLILPVIIIIINILNFSVVNLANSYYLLTGLGLMIFAIVLSTAYFSKFKKAA